MKIKYRYYSSKNCRKPQMSDALEALITRCVEEAFPLATEVEIVHVGTVGDTAHKARKSHHNHVPPDAIDVQRISVYWGSGAIPLCVDRDFKIRKVIADFIEARGGKCYHATDKGKGHLHVETIP